MRGLGRYHVRMEAQEGFDPREELAALSRGLRNALDRRAALGLTRVSASRPRTSAWESSPGPPGTDRARPTEIFSETGVARSPIAEENRTKALACSDLESLRAAVAQCTACALHRTRTQTVFSDGTGKARVMFVGEAPGQNEDEQGVPFVGRAGALLTDIITKGMRLDRREVYIANVLKCRPPDNRDPLPEEKELCTPFLDRQMELVDPEIVITLGLHAAHHVLRTQASMAKLRGQVHRVGKHKVVATYHPAFLLRSPQMKKECWKDIQLAMKELGLVLPL